MISAARSAVSRLAAVGLALCAGPALAALDYVVPWEVNPTLVARLLVPNASDAAVTNVTPRAIDFSADGSWLAVSADVSSADVFAASARNVMAVSASEFSLQSMFASSSGGTLVKPTVAGTAASLGLSSPLVLATGGDGGATLALDPAAGVAKRLPNAAWRDWTRRVPPQAVAVTGDAFSSAAAFALAPDGATAGASLTAAGTIDTGLSKISSVAVYTVGKPAAETKTTYAVVGEASASAETRGRVLAVDLATGDVTTLLDDAGRFGGGIASVRMSRTDTYRPRLYVLTADGAIFCHYLTEDLATVKASYAYANAELLTAAGAPFADAAAARVTAFDVSPDGGTLALGYAKTDASAAPTDAVTVAVIRHTPRTWRSYNLNAADNPATNGVACISDGRWALEIYWPGGGHGIGAGPWPSRSAYVKPCSDEFLDLSAGYDVTSSGGVVKLVDLGSLALGYLNSATKATNDIPRVILLSPNFKDLSHQVTKYWTGVEEVVIRAADANCITAISGASAFPATMRRAVIDFRNVKTITKNALDPNWMRMIEDEQGCGETDAGADWDFSGVETICESGFGNLAATGCLDLPSIVAISNQAVMFCCNLTEVKLSAEKRTLEYLGWLAFCGDKTRPGALRKVTIGGVDGFHFDNAVFLYQPNVEEVVFTGGAPAYVGTAAIYQDTAEKTMWFSVPRGHAGWTAALAGKVTELTDEERRAHWAAHPDRPIPFGVVTKDVFRTKNPQYVCWVGDSAGPRLTIDRDTFFDDAVEVTGDWPATADGAYPCGTTLTLTPKAAAGGAFAKWYGDVPGGASADGPLTLVLTNDVWLYARFVHPWTLSSDRKTASNGNFTVNVSVLDASARTLTLGKSEAFGLFADADVGQGVLDLGGPVRDAAGAAWTFATIPAKPQVFTRVPNGKGDATAFLSPGTLTGEWTINQGCNQDYDKSHGQSSYRLFVIDEPTVRGKVVGWSFNGQRYLTKFVFRAPKFDGLAGTSIWSGGVALEETDFGWWDLSGVTEVWIGAFCSSYAQGDGARARGVLSLPSLRNALGWQSNPWTARPALGWLPNVEGLVVGGLKRGATVTNVGQRAFSYCPKLRTLTLHNAPNMAVGAAPFENGATPAEITLTGKAIRDGGTALGKLLAGVTAAATKPVVIYASARCGWNGVDYLDALTDDELAQVPEGETALGVYRGGAEAPLGKALVIQKASPHDPKGAAVIIR